MCICFFIFIFLNLFYSPLTTFRISLTKYYGILIYWFIYINIRELIYITIYDLMYLIYKIQYFLQNIYCSKNYNTKYLVFSLSGKTLFLGCGLRWLVTMFDYIIIILKHLRWQQTRALLHFVSAFLKALGMPASTIIQSCWRVFNNIRDIKTHSSSILYICS